MTVKSIVICGAAIFTLTALMSGCSHSPSQNATQAAAASHACEANPYLMKYNCSITKVQSAAENGSADAQYALGYMYYYGIGTVRDQQTAELWIERSAAQGQPLAKKAWSLINSGATFNDLHQAAAGNDYKAPYDSRSANTIVQQEPADIDNMNKTVPTEPITNHLPVYHMAPATKSLPEALSNLNQPGGVTSGTSSEVTGTTTTTTTSSNHNSPPIAQEHHKITDPRLLPNSTPRVAKTYSSESFAGQSTTALNASSNSHAGPASFDSSSFGGTHSSSMIASNQTVQKYTVQLLASNKLSDIKAFISTHHLGSKAAYYETRLDGKPWFMLTYGQYNSAAQAESALKNMPQDLQHHQPWVKSIQTVQKEVKEQKVLA